MTFKWSWDDVPPPPEDEEKPPHPEPRGPYYVDRDGDVCDSGGWLVLVPAHDVWPDRDRLAHRICNALNGAGSASRKDLAEDLRRWADEEILKARVEKGTRHPVYEEAQRTAAAWRRAAIMIEEANE